MLEKFAASAAREAAAALAPLLLFTIFVPGGAPAQTISVYSEFVRIDPFGHPLPVDLGSSEPREILSPAVPRNAVSSFHMVVEGNPGQSYTFQVAQNPDNAVKVTAYRERYQQIGGGQWVPDSLEPVKLPYDGRLETTGISGQTAQAFWIDLTVDRNAPVRRIKVEPQAYIGEGWIRYPMEVRIVEAALGGTPLRSVSGAREPSEPTSQSALIAWQQSVCPGIPVRVGDPPTIRLFVARNAAQDVRFAGGAARPPLLRLAGAATKAGLCSAKQFSGDAEDYLTVRDTLIGAIE